MKKTVKHTRHTVIAQCFNGAKAKTFVSHNPDDERYLRYSEDLENKYEDLLNEQGINYSIESKQIFSKDGSVSGLMFYYINDVTSKVLLKIGTFWI